VPPVNAAPIVVILRGTSETFKVSDWVFYIFHCAIDRSYASNGEKVLTSLNFIRTQLIASFVVRQFDRGVWHKIRGCGVGLDSCSRFVDSKAIDQAVRLDVASVAHEAFNGTLASRVGKQGYIFTSGDVGKYDGLVRMVASEVVAGNHWNISAYKKSCA